MRLARKTALFYLFIGILWILLSDHALEFIASGYTDVLRFSKYKGLFFVGITSMLLYLFILKHAMRHEKLEAGFRDLFEQNPNAMWISRLHDQQILQANNKACELYGYSLDQFRKLKEGDLYTDDKPIINLFTRYVCHAKADGTKIWVKEFLSDTRLGEDICKLHMVVNANDVVKAEAERTALQERINELLGSMDDYVFGMDEAGFINYANPAFEKLCGFTNGIPPNTLAIPLLDGQTQSHWKDALRALKTQSKYSCEFYDSKKARWMRVISYRASKGYGVFATDISPGVHLQQKLTSFEHTLKAIVNASEDMIWAFDTQFRLLIGNDAFQKRSKAYFKRSLEAGDSILPTEVQELSNIRHWLAHFERALAGEIVDTIVEDINSKNATQFFDLSLYPIKDANDKVVCVGCFAHNATERKRRENLIQDQNKQLLDIAWIQSHELRGPLANIMGIMQLIQLKQHDAETLELYHEKMMEATHLLDQVIHKVVEKSAISFELDPRKRTSL